MALLLLCDKSTQASDWQQVSLQQHEEKERTREKERQGQKETLVIILLTSTIPHYNNTSNFVRV